jgi:uncharacterized repeat protein (TIGR02543 family)
MLILSRYYESKERGMNGYFSKSRSLKLITTTVLSVALMFTCIPAADYAVNGDGGEYVASAAAKVTKDSLKKKLDTLQEKYKTGSSGKNWLGTECIGWATYVFCHLFSGAIPRYYISVTPPTPTKNDLVLMHRDVDELYVGDYLRYNSANGYPDHSIIITNIIESTKDDDDQIYYTDKNGDGTDTVKWGKNITRKDLKTYINNKLVGTPGSEWGPDKTYVKDSTKGYIAHYKDNKVKTLSVTSPPSAKPTGVSFSKTEVAKGTVVTINWNKVDNATKYRFKLDKYNETTEKWEKSAFYGKEEIDLKKNTYSINFSIVGKYRARVFSGNDAGWNTSDAYSSNNLVVHPNSTVTFKDYNDNSLSTVKNIQWNTTVKLPKNPSREHYTFTGWYTAKTGGSKLAASTKIKSNVTYYAQYNIKSYEVKFVDNKGAVLKKQTVEALKAATPPTVTPPEGYVFVAWNKSDYKKVTGNLTITASYAWVNKDLPIVTTISKAERQSANGGYNIVVDLKNYPDDNTRGRVIATLKTAEGKMVASEIESFSTAKSATVSKTIFIPYSGVATKAEVQVIGLADDVSTGVPLAAVKTEAITLDQAWSEWSTSAPPAAATSKESRTEYRTKTRSTTTSGSSSLSGWTKTGVTYAWGAWSAYQDAKVTAKTTSPKREVQTQQAPASYKTQYRYTVWGNPKTKSVWYNKRTSDHKLLTYGWVDKPLAKDGTDYGVQWYRSPTYPNYPMWYAGKEETQKVPKSYKTQYRYRDEKATYSFEKWSGWSSWATAATAPVAGTNKQVEKRTTNRFQSAITGIPTYNYKRYVYANPSSGKVVYAPSSANATALGLNGIWEYNKSYTPLSNVSGDVYGGELDPWYKADINGESVSTVFNVPSDTMEDTLGQKRTLTGTLGYPNKKATLLVFHGNNTDPTANQLEYTAQTTLGADGSYSFTYKTQKEPNHTTGDFIIMIAVESGTTPIYIETIEAPKPSHVVTFVDPSGEVLRQETVEEGGSATPPEIDDEDIPEGEVFEGWSKTPTNITEDMTIQAETQKEMFTIIYIDDNGVELGSEELEYDSVIAGPAVEREHYIFTGWAEDGDSDATPVTSVTRNIILVAQFTPEEYTVSFTDYDGNVIQSETVPYEAEVEAPVVTDVSALAVSPYSATSATLPATTDDGQVFAYWSDYGYLYAESDMLISPVTQFAETTPTPTASVNGRTVTLDVPDGSVVYYTTDGTLPALPKEMGDGEEGIAGSNGTQYAGPIDLAEGATLIWIAFTPGAKNDSWPGYVSLAVDGPTDNSSNIPSDESVNDPSGVDNAENPGQDTAIVDTPPDNPSNILINPADGSANIPSVGNTENPSQNTETISLSAARITLKSSAPYSGKAINPEVTVELGDKTLEFGKDYTAEYSNNIKVGKALVTIRGAGAYSDSKTAAFKIVPKTISIKNVTMGKSEMKVTWKKLSGTTRYQIRYKAKGATAWKSRSVSAKKTRLTLTRLKRGKKYQLQLRSYRTVAGSKYYSAWSRTEMTKAVR